MNSPTINPLAAFEWTVQPAAEELVSTLVAMAGHYSPATQSLARRMIEETGTRLIDWIDSLTVPVDSSITWVINRNSPNESRPPLTIEGSINRQAAAVGFVGRLIAGGTIWEHPQGLFPTLISRSGSPWQLTIRVESVSDYLLANGITAEIEGAPLGQYRRACVSRDGDCELWVAERHGYRGFEPQGISQSEAAAVGRQLAAFRGRQRVFDRESDGFAHASQLIRQSQDELGTDWTCDLFFRAEREFWQSRNYAARIQKARQDALGLGWANHDHHTYRSSRDEFTRLVAVLEQLGFECRERFYGGHGAGWGAQVLEQPQAQVVIFADVDLSPEEVSGDFAHHSLAARDSLGTVGLWCKLHGEAFLAAGMHHLECRFDFDAARDQLRAAGVESMKPFTDFDFLKQAFTAAEIWPVDPARVAALQAARLIDRDQAARFLATGALGSHLEILQRDDGYKGFNQTGISQIIRQTDPRHA